VKLTGFAEVSLLTSKVYDDGRRAGTGKLSQALLQLLEDKPFGIKHLRRPVQCNLSFVARGQCPRHPRKCFYIGIPVRFSFFRKVKAQNGFRFLLEKLVIACPNLDTHRGIARAVIVSEPLAVTDRYRVFFSTKGSFFAVSDLRPIFAGTKRRSM
jgi:hypothetical protein